MYVTTAMVVIMIVWGMLTLIERGGQLPPAPMPGNLNFSEHALGWLKPLEWFVQEAAVTSIAEDAPSIIGAIGLMIAFGHSVLAMSGRRDARAGQPRA